MKRQIIKQLIIGIITTLFLTAPPFARSDEKGAASPAEQKNAKPLAIPFNGKIHSIDKVAKTITLEGKERKRTLYLTSETKIIKAGKPAALDDAAAGEQVGGQLRKNAEGKEEVISLRIGPKPEDKGKAGSKSKEEKNEE